MNTVKRAERNKGLETGVNELVALEFDYALGEHGLYHSPHEAWAVILEELEETKDEVEEAKADFTKLYGPIFRERDPQAMHRIAGAIAKDARKIMTEAAHLAAAAEKLAHTIECAPNSYFRKEEKQNGNTEED